jgi:DNA-directed RNA polymerase I subunit RPA43
MAPIDSSQSEPQSLFRLERITQYVSLSPASLASPLPSLCVSIFSPLLLSYYPPARGIVLAYQDVEISEEPPIPSSTTSSSNARGTKRKRKSHHDGDDNSDADEDTQDRRGEVLLKVVDEYSAPFLWATATLLVLRPHPHARVEAKISHQAATHITLSYLNAFSISVLKAQLPRDWRWNGASGDRAGRKGRQAADEGAVEGFWVDGDGMPVPDVLGVWIRDWDAKSGARGKGFLRMEGSLVAPGEENGAEETQGQGQGQKSGEKVKKKTKSALRKSGAKESVEVD